ncbi:MAG: cysteine--tRNA ligase [Candidatus Caenarcaniphilales bacterium]|nr:cysteine--tRNA ligase [Candidatus Caenarcaniphilales bacterium]
MSELYFYNSLTRSREKFEPLVKNKVSIYTCGPTVYDSSHIGHARSVIVWDCLARYLRFLGYDVAWARNITDIDDKIINRSKEKGISPELLARTETFKFWKDMQDLNIFWPDFEPRATENLSEMFDFIQGLLNKKAAYQATNGDVYFRVQSFKEYGQLKNLAELKDTVSRIEHQEVKENVCDFALWKAFPEDDYGYASPFGHGRPGWHLECSTMIKRYFGETIDIHGGGEDLVFPHHENEIAQSECLHNGTKFARFWLHNAMILVNGKKMSKSEGNYITIQDSLKSFCGNTIRFFVLSAHYRQPVNYTEDALVAASHGFQRLFKALNQSTLCQEVPLKKLNQSYVQKFKDCMSEDLNTACALSILFEMVKEINKGDTELEPTLRELMKVLGFNLQISYAPTSTICLEPIFELLIEMRNKARQSKDFAMADQIRQQFDKAGFVLKDSPEGTKVEPK